MKKVHVLWLVNISFKLQLWFRCEVGSLFHEELNAATFSTCRFIESLPKVFRLLYLGPICPTPPQISGFVCVQNGKLRERNPHVNDLHTF